MFSKKKEEEKKKGGFLKGMILLGSLLFVGNKILSPKKEERREEKLNKNNKVKKPIDPVNKKTIEIAKFNEEDRKREFFLVSQNTNFEEEFLNSYIWAPREGEGGRSIFHWENLSKVKKDDIIFSLVNNEIVSVNKALEDNYEYEKNNEMGYRVDLEYNRLETPIDLEKYMDKVLELSPDKYAPFNKKGRRNSGYLFEIGDKLGNFILDKSK